MSITHTLSFGWAGAAGQLAQQVARTSANANEQNFSAALTAGTTNQQRDVEWAQAKLLSLFVLSDQDVTLKVNSSGSPTDTITIKAGVPFVWVKDAGVPYPFVGTAGAVTATYWTNAGAVTANVEFRALIEQ